MRSLSARDIALGAKRGSLLRRPVKGAALAVPVVRRYRLRQRHRHLNNRQETEMTDATVEQQGEPKRRKEHPEALQAADSSSSSSSESSTDTEMGLVDVCTILRQKADMKVVR